MILNMTNGMQSKQEFIFTVDNDFTFTGNNWYEINNIEIYGGLIRSFLIRRTESFGVDDYYIDFICRWPNFTPSYSLSVGSWASYYKNNGTEFEKKYTDMYGADLFEYDGESKIFKLKFKLYDTGLILKAGSYKLVIW